MFKNFVKNLFSKGTRTLTTLRTSSGEFLLKKTDFGLVHVEYATIQKIAKRAIADVKGINETELAVEKTSDKIAPLKIELMLSLSEGFSALKAKEAVDKAINDALREYLQLEFYVPVDVKVEQIKQPEVEQRRRVR